MVLENHQIETLKQVVYIHNFCNSSFPGLFLLNKNLWQRRGVVFRQTARYFDVDTRVVRTVVQQHRSTDANGLLFELELIITNLLYNVSFGITYCFNQLCQMNVCTKVGINYCNVLGNIDPE